jgi:triosephosphate isomerase
VQARDLADKGNLMTTTRRPIVAGNWKMNTTVPEATVLAAGVREAVAAVHGVEVVVCPPAVSLTTVHAVLEGCDIGLGAQDAYFEASGAHTGEVSVEMVASTGATYVIAGHSERRARFGDTDEWVSRKVRAILARRLVPIMCVGETLDEHDAGQTDAVVTRQIRAGLEGIGADDASRVVVAYEPVWAIGTGRPATPEGANETCGTVRAVVADLYGDAVAQAIRIQYGGSVTQANAAALFAQPHIDGALVGGASLVAANFAAIATAASARLG